LPEPGDSLAKRPEFFTPKNSGLSLCLEWTDTSERLNFETDKLFFTAFHPAASGINLRNYAI